MIWQSGNVFKYEKTCLAKVRCPSRGHKLNQDKEHKANAKSKCPITTNQTPIPINIWYSLWLD